MYMCDLFPPRRNAWTLSVLAIAFIVSLPAVAPAQNKVPPQLSAAIEQVEGMTATELAKDNLGSVTVGIISGPDLIWARSFGMADMEKKIPATTDSVYRIGSITKQFTALMLLQLVDVGKVHLTEPIEKYLPEINRLQGRQAWYPSPTFVQLATMTSGLDREPEDLATYTKGPVSEWEKILISAVPHVKYLYEPDTHYYYSNIGYAILGAALGRVARQPYVDYVKEHIFAPLRMTHTAFEPNPDIQPWIASGYDVGRDGKVDAETPAREHAGRGYKVPNGAIYTTVADLSRFVSFELGEGPETVLNKKVLADNFTRTNSSVMDLGLGYGIGFMVSRRGDFVFYGHGGSVAGYNAEANFDRTSKIGVVVLRNVTGGKFNVGILAEKLLMTVATAAKPKTATQQ
jgi:CubicO group peptidase (beta-lactamase class C family)